MPAYPGCPEKLVPCGTNGRLLLSGFQALVTLTLDQVIWHTIMHQSVSSIYISNFIEIGKTFFVKGLCAGTPPSSRSRDGDTNLGQIAKIRLQQIEILCCSLRISGHLPAAVVNGGGDRPTKVQLSELQKPRDLDLGSGHTAYRCASVIDLYLHTKFHWNHINFLWMDVRTYVPTDGHFRPPWRSRPKKGR